MNYKKITLSIIAIWLLIVFFAVVKNEYTLIHGRSVLLKTIPIDPRDLFMGDYVILNYEIKQLPRRYKYDFYQNKNIWVELELKKNGIAEIEKIHETKPEKGLFIKGKVDNCHYVGKNRYDRKQACSTINYQGIENYFVEEGTGRPLERDMENGGLVEVSIDKFGNAKIKGFKTKTPHK